ncbi:ABC transporter permease [Chitinilyticum piscinae]|uniref:ABC transporter permease n=1 Tax=Chitinilyticum piscinae TaxID=2866724 RepID=A0A8J7FJF5_9NEIS|nr:FtsX-like permease family protein [Chitinilyticum piscinae]MBE9608637.1 ABC transporter permease [Chitinilyticum piscinae]
MNAFSLALRNLLRNRRRSLTTLLAMMIGVSAILLFGGYSRNINLGLQTDFVRGSGHLQIQHTDYFLYGSGNPAAYGIADYPRIIATLQNDPVLAPMLTVVTPRLSLGGIAGNFDAGVSRTVFGAGVDIAGQNAMLQWNDYDFPGVAKTSPLTGSRSDAAVIGTGVARVLQLCEPLQVQNCPGAQRRETDGAAAPADITALSAQEQPQAERSASRTAIELLAANAHGAPNVARLNVIKAEAMGVKEYDDMAVQLHLQQAQRLIYGQDAPKVTAIVLQLKHTGQMPAARARLTELLAGPLKGMPLEVHDFATLNPQYGQITGMFAAILGFIAILIGAIVLFTVSNTMSMAVVERTVEIGTLRALGLRRSGIRRLFVCEGALLGAVGALCGIVLALLVAYAVNHSGLTWLPPGNVDPVPLTIRVWGEPAMIGRTALGLMLVATLSAWWPARRAAKLNIVDALRHV